MFRRQGEGHSKTHQFCPLKKKSVETLSFAPVFFFQKKNEQKLISPRRKWLVPVTHRVHIRQIIKVLSNAHVQANPAHDKIMPWACGMVTTNPTLASFLVFFATHERNTCAGV